MKKPIGILGGMGPLATVDAMSKIIKNTNATCDQEHIPVITVSIPDIPDRTQSILNHDNKPLEKMSEYLKILENAQAGCIIIPCNTAHFWFNQLQARTPIKMISIIEATINHIKKNHIEEVCILATSATIATQLYQTKLTENNIGFIVPDTHVQQKVMDSIYHYKSGKYAESKAIINEVINVYGLDSGIKFLLACTELPIILEEWITNYPNLFIDATDILIQDAIGWYQSQPEI